MINITAAYNFAPVTKDDKEFVPDWADQVSMEVPLKENGQLDSYTGEITYDIMAHTPIFIRSGKGDNSFTHVDKYFIPGTTLKGCFRSVLEIMSFGRMKGRVNKAEFQFRDLQNREYRNAMGTVYCGFLNERTGEITNYGIPHQIKYKEINTICPNIKNMSALEKYEKFGLVQSKFEFSYKDNKTKKEFYKLGSKGQRGYLFFSGQMGNKKSDFVLLDKDSSRYSLTVDKGVISNFKKCYEKVPNIDLGIPVFFTMNNNKVKTIGLCYNHRYIAQNDTEKAIPEGLRRNEPDLADVIFGYVDPNTKKAVKGRVQFQPAFISKFGEAIDSPILTVLGSPRPSFYPTYLQGLATWDKTAAIIAGYKRYPIKNTLETQGIKLSSKERNNLEAQFPSEKGTQNFYEFVYKPEDKEDVKLIPRDGSTISNFDTLSLLKPLGKGTEFKGRITFFNLKKVELGALLSAMTFLDNKNKCYHSIGSAKAMGFGAVEISNISVKLRMNPIAGNELSISNNIRNEAHEAFKRLMRGFIPNYEKCSRIQDLIDMAKDNSFISEELVPPQLADFAPWKKDWNKHQATFPCFSILVSQKKKKKNK